MTGQLHLRPRVERGSQEPAGQRTLRVAVIGMGQIGTRHLEILGRIDAVRPVAVSRRPERLKELAAAGREVAGLNGLGGAGATLGIVASDTGRHAEDALAAIAQGLDLLVEKPLAVTAPEAARVRDAAAKAGRRLFVGCVLRCAESLTTFRRLLADIGTLHAVRIDCHSYLPEWRPDRPYRETYSARAGEGGVLHDLIHEIDYAGWIFGWPSALQARLNNWGRLGIAAEESAELNWELAGGGIVSVNLDYLSRPPYRRMRAYGEDGSLEWDGISGTVTLQRPDAPRRVIASSQTREALFLAQTRAFLAACCEGAPSPLASGDEGCRAVSVCDAARQASRTRCETRVEYL